MQRARRYHLVAHVDVQEKKVHVVQSGNLPLNKVYPDHFRRRVQQEIEARGVNFIFDDRLDESAPVDGVVHTRKGKVIPADLVVCPNCVLYARRLPLTC